MPTYTKPSKYKLNSNVQAKVYTGLDAGSAAKELIQTSV
jgi:hypothetical protein